MTVFSGSMALNDVAKLWKMTKNQLNSYSIEFIAEYYILEATFLYMYSRPIDFLSD